MNADQIKFSYTTTGQ